MEGRLFIWEILTTMYIICIYICTRRSLRYICQGENKINGGTNKKNE